MKSSRGVRLITDVIAKRTTTTTTATAKAAAAEPLNYYEAQCPHVAANNTIVSNASSAIASTATESFDYAGTTAARPYSEVPGPKPLPILGNTWRFVLLLLHLKNYNAIHKIYIIHSSQCSFPSFLYFD